MSRSSAFRIEKAIPEIEKEVGRLSPAQKILLGTDGSVTCLLEVITGSPVEIETLAQKIVSADRSVACKLDIEEGDDVNYREVKLKNSVTEETLIHAISYTPIKRLEPRFKEDLTRADIPIGLILKKHRIESRRDITSAQVLKESGALHEMFNVFSKEPMLSRNYKIIRGGHPLMAITETFPYNNFQDRHRVIVETPSRIHMTLTDLSGKCGRVDGGVGLTLDEPNIMIEAERSEDLEVKGENADRAELAARMVMDQFNLCGAKIAVRSCYKLHVGLGGGTQLAVAVGKALCELYDTPATVRDIAIAVSRGGTSGVGVAAFESGGFIVDGGHTFGPGKDKIDFRPSSASSGVAPPPVIMQHPFPESWKVILATPNIDKGAYGKRELDIFGKYCPVPVSEVHELCHQIMARMMPSIIEEDLDSFGKAVNRVQELGFKNVEVRLQHPLIRDLMTGLKDAGAAGAGLSSFGPAVYAIADTETRDIESMAHEIMKDVGGEVLITKARNSGAKVRMA